MEVDHGYRPSFDMTLLDTNICVDLINNRALGKTRACLSDCTRHISMR